jgi:hypothetical protein
MLYSEFVTSVTNLLAVEANRRGLETYRDQHIRNCLADLQRYIPSFRVGNVTTYTQADVTIESRANLIQLPDGCTPRAFYIYSSATPDDPNCKRFKLDWFPWDRRQEMICGRLDYRNWWNWCWRNGPGPCPTPPAPDPSSPNPWSWAERRAYVVAVSPHTRTAVFYPPLNAYTNLKLVWDGFKMTYNAGDWVPYPEQASEAVAAWILSKIHRIIDKNLPLAAADWQDYLTARRALIRDYRESQTINGEDEEYVSNLINPPAAGLVAAGAQSIAYLQLITALEGVTPNCLAYIPTVNIGTPQPVIINVGAGDVVFTLKPGVDADDPANGVVRPNDWATSQKVWYQSNL